eukprot:TRINITY_DN21981_c0_g1_i1.p1 TRINITY_DN21981_c0_g1~~TRINITY_DN21981_c0_g1_i1.p1  ORF type:complete len:134 (+),score=34.04 TRINITY_DN21981_c0_g1_i1:63-464(+)
MRPGTLARSLGSSTAIVAYTIILVFIVFSGSLHAFLVSAPSMGTYIDAQGRRHNQPVLKGKLNGQYISEGFAAGIGMVLASAGWLLLDNYLAAQANASASSRQSKSQSIKLGLYAAMIVLGLGLPYGLLSIKL